MNSITQKVDVVLLYSFSCLKEGAWNLEVPFYPTFCDLFLHIVSNKDHAILNKEIIMYSRRKSKACG